MFFLFSPQAILTHYLYKWFKFLRYLNSFYKNLRTVNEIYDTCYEYFSNSNSLRSYEDGNLMKTYYFIFNLYHIMLIYHTAL